MKSLEIDNQNVHEKKSELETELKKYLEEDKNPKQD